MRYTNLDHGRIPHKIPPHQGPGMGGGGGTLIFSYMRRLGHVLGLKILNFNIFWGFRKMNVFGGV